MESAKIFAKKSEIDINEYYSVNIKSLWKGLKQEHVSLWFLCLYIFFEYIRPQSLYPVIDILPWARIFLFLSLFAALLDKSSRWVGHVENKLLIAFSIVLILSGIFAFDPSYSWKSRDLILNWVVDYFLFIAVINTEKRMFLFLLAYLLFNLKMAQHGAVAWTERGFSFASYGLIGSPGFFRNSGEYAIQMLIYGSLAIAFVFSLKENWGRYKKWIFIILAATGFMAVMGSSSRGAQIALAGIGIWALLKQKGGFKGLLAIIILGIVLYFLLPDKQIQRFAEIGQDKNSLQRLTYWTIALKEIIPNHLLLGVGYANWLPYLDYLHPNGVGVLGINQVCHNIYIQAASELGIPGLVLFLAMAFYAFRTNAKTRNASKLLGNKFMFYLSYGLDAGLIGFLIAGSFVTVLFYPFFWIQMAMIVALNNIAKNTLKDHHNAGAKHSYESVALRKIT